MELIEWSIVPVPADADAVRSAYHQVLDSVLSPTTRKTSPLQTSESDMTEQEVAAAVERALSKRDEAAQRSDEIKNAVREVLTETLKEMGGLPDAPAVPATTDAPAVPTTTVVPATTDTPAVPTTAAAVLAEGDQQALIDAGIEARSEVMELCRDLLPEGFDPKGKSNKDVLVAAAGTEIEKAAERSEDYLRAKLEDIAARRATAQPHAGTNLGLKIGATPVPQLTRSLSAVDIQQLARQKGVAA